MTVILDTTTTATVGSASLVGRIWRLSPLMPWSGDTSAEAATYRTRNAGKTRDVRAWLGVRYAHAPIGNRRWREAQDYTYPAGTHQCTSPGGVPIQTSGALEFGADGRPEWGIENGPYNWRAMGTEESEDCLFLHIWAPSGTPPAGGWPVVFWVHGGGFVQNSAITYQWRGHRLATKGVVVVSVEYRMSNFGFFHHPDFAGEADWRGPNFWLSDVKSALRWVNSNIAAFQGNPAKVMVGGSSAGGITSYALLEDPSVQSLFSSVWASSGGGIDKRRSVGDTSYQVGYGRRYGVFAKAARMAAPIMRDYSNPTRTLAQGMAALGEGQGMRMGLSPDHILAFSNTRKRLWRGRVNADGSEQGLIAGEALMTAESGAVNDYPYVGNGITQIDAVTAARAGLFTKPTVLLVADHEASLQPSYTTWTEAQQTAYLRLIGVPNFADWNAQPFVTSRGWGAAEKNRRIYMHTTMGFPAWRMARAMVTTGSAPAYLCLWGFSQGGAAWHSSDFHYVTGNVEWNVFLSGNEAQVTTRALLMGDVMTQKMANLANSGNPNTGYSSATDFSLFASLPPRTFVAANATDVEHWNIIGHDPAYASDAANAPVQVAHQAYLPGAWLYYNSHFPETAAVPVQPPSPGWDDNAAWAD